MRHDIIIPGTLDAPALAEALETFLTAVQPERQRLADYYAGRQSVPKGEAVRGRPNNHLRIPFPRYITEVQTGYFLGLAPAPALPEGAAAQRFRELSRQVNLPHLMFDAGRDASICGTGFLLVWLERSGLRACRCDPAACFLVRSAAAGAPVIAAVRLLGGGDPLRGILYTPEALTPFTYTGHGGVHLGTPEENLLRSVPVVPFANNCQETGDFEMVTGLVDAYNLLLSGAMDDMQSVANAFLALYGMQGTTQSDLDRANRSRVLSLSEGGRAEFVVKSLNHEALGQLEQNLRRAILQLSMTPDLSDESFAGNASGVALQYKLWGIEQVRSAKERTFADGLRHLMHIFTAAEALLGGSGDFTAAEFTFYKNLPQDHTELAQTLLKLSPILSNRTILEHLPYTPDPEEELRRKRREQAEQA